MHLVFKISKLLNRLFTAFLFLLLFSCSSDHRNGSYTIGVDVAWYGIDFLGQQNNVTGFSRDLLKEIGKTKKVKFNFLPVNWDTLIPHLKTGQYDGILSSLYPYIFNQPNFDFSQPYLLTGPVLVIPISVNWKDINQLSGKEIAVLTDTQGTLLLEKNPAILIRPYDSIPQALNDVLAGILDGAILDVIPADSYCENLYAGKLKIAAPPFNDQGLRLLTPTLKFPELIQLFNEGLDELKKNGTYDTLLKKWSLGQGYPISGK